MATASLNSDSRRTFIYMIYSLGILSLLEVSVDSVSSAGLDHRLRKYVLLTPANIEGFSHSRYKRSLSRDQPQLKDAIEEIQVSLFDERFELSLYQNSELLAPGFSVSTLNSDGSESIVPFDPYIFYRGIVKKKANTDVFLHWVDSSAISAKIVTEMETYYIEPSEGLLPKSSNYTMIAYKESDLLNKDRLLKDYLIAGVHHNISSPDTDSHTYSSEQITVPLDEDSQARVKRQADTGSKNTCGLLLVVDQKFLNGVMGGSRARAANYIIDLVARVNEIYRKTTFGEFSGYGFQVESIKIHSNYSLDPDHYNFQRPTVQTVDENAVKNPINVLLDIIIDERCTAPPISSSSCDTAVSSNCISESLSCNEQSMLNAFGRVDKTFVNYRDYCLAHLFTAYAFSNGVLGLAYIASPSKSTYGGICSKAYYETSIGQNIYLNTGWSSALNKEGEKILTQEAEIVLAHELGHNWGSEHDPDTQACSPSGSAGKYIMNTYAVDGFKENHRKFSECSRASIGQVLANKADDCFKESSDQSRGNFFRNEEEECDAGLIGDDCCTNYFKYKNGATCSETNDICCKNCSIVAARNKECATSSEFTCTKHTFCDGLSSLCPVQYEESGSKCQHTYGRCIDDINDLSHRARICAPLPEVIGLKQCLCSDEEDLCVLCHITSSGCKPFNTSTLKDYIKCPSDSSSMCETEAGKLIMPYILSEMKQYIAEKNHIILLNSTCLGGFCDAIGKCIKRQSTDVVARFWDFLTHLDPSAFVQFMRANIVGSVIVFSLILWLPCVITVYCYDKKQAKKAKLEERAINSIRRHPIEERIITRPQMH